MASISANGSNGHHKFTLNVTESFVSDGAANYSTVKWSLVLSSLGGGYNWSYSATVPVTWKVTINGTTYSGNIMSYDGSSNKTVGSGSLKVTHDINGSKTISFSFSVSSINAYYLPGSASKSGSMALTNIGRGATAVSATNFNDTGNPTLTYSNPAGSSVSSLQACISLTGSTADVPYRDISTSGTTYTFNLTDAERNTLRAATPNNNTLTVYFYVQTVINGVTFRSNTPATMTIVNGNPTFSSAYLDSNSTTAAITGNNQLIIQSQSTLRVNVTNATALKYATLSTVNCVINGTTYSGTLSSSSYTFNIGTLNISSNTTALITVTDSRGNSSSTSLNITVLPWSLPTAIITAQRENNFYSATAITVDADFSSVDSKNTLTIQLRYKKTTASSYSSWTTMQDNVSQTFTLDNNYAWDVQVKLTDRFGSTTYNLVVNRGMPIIYFDRLKSSVGVNCFPIDNESLEVNGVPVNRNIATCGLTTSVSSLTANAYTNISLDKSLIAGGRLTTSGGGILIGEGVSKVLVSGQMIIQATNKAGVRYFRIIRNNDATKVITWICGTVPAGSQYPLILTPALGEVQQGDVITMQYYTIDSDDQIISSQMSSANYGTRTNMTIEVVG